MGTGRARNLLYFRYYLSLEDVVVKFPVVVFAQGNQVFLGIDNRVWCSYGIASHVFYVTDIDMD